MDNGISSYGNDIGRVYSKYSNKYYDMEDMTNENNGKSDNYLDFDSYLQLLVAQMSNQDFNDPMSDSEMLTQMAQYSMLEGIKNMTQQSNISYASSLVGKVVTVNNNGSYLTGKVDSISIENSEPYLVIGGNKFKSSTVTDIVDQAAYDNLNYLIGMTATIEGNDENPTVTGEITHVLFMDGEGWVAVNGHAYRLSEVTQIVGEGSEGTTTTTDKIEGDDGAEEESSEESDDEGDLVTETSEVNTAAQTYSTRSQALVDILMKELDRVDEVSEADSAANAGTMSEADVNYVLQTAYVEVPDYSAAFFGDEISLTTAALENVDTTYGKGDTTYTISNTVKDKVSSVSNSSSDYTRSSSLSSGSVRGVTTSAGVSTSDCVPHRISVENYPEEAALADELGTRMYDIRFINNHDVTSRVKTGPVIGRTQSGRGITEIGYSGVGQLGEVVTFADGTQRVEILLKNGHSTWLNTSGKYTLDEICTKNGAPGSLSGLTPSEKAIRHYSEPFSNLSQTPLDSFKNYLIAQGHA